MRMPPRTPTPAALHEEECQRLRAAGLTPCRCDHCGTVEDRGVLRAIILPQEGGAPGSPAPAGACPLCGHLSYPIPPTSASPANELSGADLKEIRKALLTAVHYLHGLPPAANPATSDCVRQLHGVLDTLGWTGPIHDTPTNTLRQVLGTTIDHLATLAAQGDNDSSHPARTVLDRLTATRENTFNSTRISLLMTYLVIAVYEDSFQRYAAPFQAESPAHAEEQAQDDAQASGGRLIIAAVIACDSHDGNRVAGAIVA
jgi:hypothetical protein